VFECVEYYLGCAEESQGPEGGRPPGGVTAPRLVRASFDCALNAPH